MRRRGARSRPRLVGSSGKTGEALQDPCLVENFRHFALGSNLFTLQSHLTSADTPAYPAGPLDPLSARDREMGR